MDAPVKLLEYKPKKSVTVKSWKEMAEEMDKAAEFAKEYSTPVVIDYGDVRIYDKALSEKEIKIRFLEPAEHMIIHHHHVKPGFKPSFFKEEKCFMCSEESKRKNRICDTGLRAWAGI